MRVADQVLNALLQVESRDRRDFQEGCRFQTLHRVIEGDRFAACHFPGVHAGYSRVRNPDVYIATEYGFFRAALSGEGQRGFTDDFFDFRFKEHDLFSCAGEFDFLVRGDNFDFIVRLEAHVHVLDVVFHGKHGDRNLDDVTRRE